MIAQSLQLSLFVKYR